MDQLMINMVILEVSKWVNQPKPNHIQMVLGIWIMINSTHLTNRLG